MQVKWERRNKSYFVGIVGNMKIAEVKKDPITGGIRANVMGDPNFFGNSQSVEEFDSSSSIKEVKDLIVEVWKRKVQESNDMIDRSKREKKA